MVAAAAALGHRRATSRADGARAGPAARQMKTGAEAPAGRVLRRAQKPLTFKRPLVATLPLHEAVATALFKMPALTCAMLAPLFSAL